MRYHPFHHTNFTVYLLNRSFLSCTCRVVFARMQEIAVKTDK